MTETRRPCARAALAQPKFLKATRSHSPTGARVQVCPHCGGIHPIEPPDQVGMRILTQLGRVGLGPGTPPLLSEREGDVS